MPDEYADETLMRCARKVAEGTEVHDLAAYSVGVGRMVFREMTRERARGRFVLTPPEQIDERWLEENVLRFKPEIVGAAIDNKIGAPEVAGILAALANEKKIETTVEQRRMKRPRLCMKLLVGMDQIEGHWHALLKRLFFKGQQTDTDAIRKHYEKCGFEPASLIRKGIEGELATWPKWKKKKSRLTASRSSTG